MKNQVTALFFMLFMLFTSGCAHYAQSGDAAAARPVSAGDNSMVSLDWEGVYRGVLPCADCRGIETEVTVEQGGRAIVRRTYAGKSERVFTEEGRLTWDAKGRTIAIRLKDGDVSHYLVGENRLVMLDREGNRITGQLAERYILRKIAHPAFVPAASLGETYWKLIELNGHPVGPHPGGKGREAHMILKNAGSRVEGSGGCNRFFGSYALKPGNRIRFYGLGSSMMACPGMDSEAAFFRVLETADSYALDGDRLQLHKARMAPLARFEAVYLK